ncbi:MAG: SRPBCC domain-containing protein [Flavobacterium sp.]
MIHTILHDFKINTSKEKVFEAVTLPNKLNNWWTLRCSGTPELGAMYNLYFAEEFNWYAEISLLKHNNQIEYSMTKAMKDWLPTYFGFILTEEKPNQTYVQFYHTNWQNTEKEYRNTSYCWANLLRQLKQYLEKGIITPFEERS